MASRLFRPAVFHGFRTPAVAASVGFSSALIFYPLLQQCRGRPLRLDSSPVGISSKDWSTSSYSNNARTPVVTKEGRFNRNAVRQLSLGSITGLVAGIAVSWFSKPLAILIGLGVVAAQTAESYGIRVIPYKTIQKYVKGIDIRSALQDNVTLKISFGLMFALSAFAEL